MNKDIYIDKSSTNFDAIVVGSGITGGWAAKEFTERGLRTLIIERGPVVTHRKDYIGEYKGPWQFEHRTKVNNFLVEQQYQVQEKCYAFNDATKHFFGNDRDLPYSTPESSPFLWIRGNQLGGKSILWHRQSYRLSDFDFEANKNDGIGIDWPIRYKDLEQWYSYVEKYVGISGNKDNIEQLPDSEYLPPFEMTSPEELIKRKIESAYNDRFLVMGRTAHLTKPTELHLQQGRVTCQARNECQKGCSFGAYFSTLSSTLPAAAKTGRLSIAPNSVVHSIIYDPTSKKARGVRVIDNNTLETREYFGKVVFMCASTLGTTQIMLNSTSSHFPNGIANSSGVLGHYLMDHNYGAGARGYIEGFDDEYYSGRRPTGMYMPNFQYKPSLYKKHYLRGYALGTYVGRENWQNMRFEAGIGADFKEKLTKPGKWFFGMYAQGEMLPRFENHVRLNENKADKWGMPTLHIDCKWSKNETDMMHDAVETIVEMMETAGIKDITKYVNYDEKPPGLAIHEVGTARMGDDPKESVLNRYNQCHDVSNLFVTDGASYCSTGTQNPSLTFMALTVRAVDYCIKQMNLGRI
ncbi:GMC oxidoreductase [Agaribacter flavus]|uniref:GMC oxidoreductase n=1 Tax=Agaribacter flavus TaxID=1902781 RepID=A0ABV7FQT4_9ALTE